MNVIQERLAALRSKMQEHGINYYVVPTADFHQSEYVGAPSSVASSENEYWVFATQIGSLSYPSFVSSLICFLAAGVKSTPSAR